MGDSSVLVIFRPELLQTDDTVTAALTAFEETLNGEPDLSSILSQSLKKSHSLPFILSCVGEHTFSLLSDWMIDQLPSTLLEFSPGMLSLKLICHLASAAKLLRYPRRQDEPEDLKNICDRVDSADIVLRQLVSVFRGEGSPKDKRNNANTSRRNTIRGIAVSGFEAHGKAFMKLGFPVPKDSSQVSEIARTILCQQKRDMEYFLSIFRKPALRDILTDTYLIQRSSDGPSRRRPTTEVKATYEVGESPVSKEIAFVPHSLKASLYAESAEGFGLWRIFLSGRATNDLRRRMKDDAKIYQITFNKLRELSHGRFSKANHKRLTGPQTPVHIFRARLPGDSRIVYQVDCFQDFGTNSESQALTVFGIYDHEELRRDMWDKLGRSLGRKGKAYCERCRYRGKDRGQHLADVYNPASFDSAPVEESYDEDRDTMELMKEDLEEMHRLLALEKYVPVSQSFLKNLLAHHVSHIFRVSSHEREVIEHDASCYILGRSGTGKTMALLFKMFGIDKAWQQEGCLRPRPRQMFVTKSRFLTEQVEGYFMQFVASLCEELQTPQHAQSLLQRWSKQNARGLTNVEEYDYWRSDLPRKYSELTDDNFPLFITFDDLCALIAADLASEATADQRVGAQARRSSSLSLHSWNPDAVTRPLSFDTFKTEYWSHFAQNLTKGLAPSLVYGEFIGVIKGSQATLNISKHVLDRKTYVNMSDRMQPTFAGKRDIVYTLFDAYMKRKSQRGERDTADRTHAVLDAIGETDLITDGQKVDFLYVDEVQDLLLIDTLLLRRICRNPHGLHWAGDTAQTISLGSAFRFNDLKSFLYEYERKSCRWRTSKDPSFFQLPTNYRSHGGIVDCSNSIIELIKRFWPNSIDNLQPERGVVGGVRPVFLTGWEGFQYQNFFTTGNGVNSVELGARQCILVRDQATRDKLKNEIGSIGLVLTLYDSKGLEYDDVLLYGFFENTLVDVSQWRKVVCGVLNSKFDKSQSAQLGNEFPAICSELKYLYVAITRARKRLWLVDRSEKCEPIKMYWKDKNIVELYTAVKGISEFAVPSKPEDWIQTANTLFQNKNFGDAAESYRKAQMSREAAIAHAYWLEEDARTLPVRAGTQRTQAFLKAAEAFLSCAEGRTSLDERTDFLRHAGHCFDEAKRHHLAAKAFEDASMFSEAVSQFRLARMLPEAMAIIRAQKNSVNDSIAERITETARYAWTKAQDFGLLKDFDLFKTDEEQEVFMEDHDFAGAHANFLERRGRYADAADKLHQEGQVLSAIRLLLMESCNENSIKKAAAFLLESLWSYLSFGIQPASVSPRRSSELSELFEVMKQLSLGDLDPKVRKEFEVFVAIYSSDMASLKRRGHTLCTPGADKALTLLCLDHLIDDEVSQLQFDTQDHAILSLDLFHNYTQLMREVIIRQDPWMSNSIRKLLSFYAVTDHSVVLRHGSFLHLRYCLHHSLSPMDQEDIAIERVHFLQLVRQHLVERLRTRVLAENEICEGKNLDGDGVFNRDSPVGARVFDPCLSLATSFRTCTDSHCLKVHQLDEAWYNRRVRFHFRQVVIIHTFQTVPGAQDFPTRMKLRRDWLAHLEDTFHPLAPRHGSMSVMRIDEIPELNVALRTSGQWAKDILYKIEPYGRENVLNWFLMDFLKATAIISSTDSHFLKRGLYRVPCVSYHRQRHPKLLIGDEYRPYYVLYDLINFLNAGPRDLYLGARFFQYVVRNQIHVDHSSLCHLLDRLCGLFSLSIAYQSRGLHNVILPRSWFHELGEDFNNFKSQGCGSYELVVDSIQQLLEDVYRGSFTRDPPHKVSRVPLYQVRQMAIARICRAICILGYNVNDDNLKTKIFRSISSLKDVRSLIPVCRPYVFAGTWDDLKNALCGSGSLLDEMIQLYHTRGSQHIRTLPGVRRILFSTHGDILDKLNLSHRPQSAANIASPDPHHKADAPTLAKDNASQTEVTEHTRAPSPLMDETVVSPDLNQGQSLSSEKHDTAARVIQKVYRCLSERRKAAPVHGLAARRSVYFAECLHHASTIEWTKRSYRVAYLGLLPHLLLCLNWTLQQATEKKKEQKKKLATMTSLDDMDQMRVDQVAINGILKKARELDKILKPSSPLHLKCDQKWLRYRAGEVHDLLKKLPPPQQMEFDMSLVIKGLSEKRRAKKAPMLNVEDLYE